MTYFIYTIIEGPDVNGKYRWDSEWEAPGPWGSKHFTTFHADLKEHVTRHIRNGNQVKIVDPRRLLKTVFLTETAYSSMRGALDDRLPEEKSEVMRMASGVKKADRVIIYDAWGYVVYDGPIPVEVI